MENPAEKSIVKKCKFCHLIFKTKNGHQVHMDMEHQTKHVKGESLKCNAPIPMKM